MSSTNKDMFTPIYLLPQYNIKDFVKYRDRWHTLESQKIKDDVYKIIRDGAGEDCLEYLYEENKGFFDDKWDLKGLVLIGLEVDFPQDDNFEAIDFKYAYLGNLKFKNAVFYTSNLQFTKIHGCEFSNCIFILGGFYGSQLKNTKFNECDFVDIRITNCEFEDVKFNNCFLPERLFFECRFDENTILNHLSNEPRTMSGGHLRLNKTDIAEIYKGVKESYLAGGVIDKSRTYLYKQKQSITRYNTSNWCKFGGYFLEFTAGYGTNPIRVLVTMLFFYLLFTIIFSVQVGWSDGYLLSAGAFFTFGVKAHLLDQVGIFFKGLYIFESFVGLSLVALFITVLFNYWFQER